MDDETCTHVDELWIAHPHSHYCIYLHELKYYRELSHKLKFLRVRFRDLHSKSKALFSFFFLLVWIQFASKSHFKVLFLTFYALRITWYSFMLPSVYVCHLYVCMLLLLSNTQTHKQERETETDIMRDRDERDRDIIEVIHITGGCQL